MVVIDLDKARRCWTQGMFAVAAMCGSASAWAGWEASSAATASIASMRVAETPAWLNGDADCIDGESGSGSGFGSGSGSAGTPAAPAKPSHDVAAPAGKAATPPQPQPGAAAASPAAATPAPVAAVTGSWDIRALDRTLNVALARWATSAGWQLIWEVPVDYAIEADTRIPGSFEQAIETVTRSMETAEIPMKAIFYKGNHVIRIVVKGAE